MVLLALGSPFFMAPSASAQTEMVTAAAPASFETRRVADPAPPTLVDAPSHRAAAEPPVTQPVRAQRPPSPQRARDRQPVITAAKNSSENTIEAQVSSRPLATETVANSPPPRASQLTTAAPTRLPDSRRLNYDVAGEVKHFPYSAHAELNWVQDGSSYTVRLEIAALFVGSRVQTSSGQVTADGLAPVRFSDKVKSEVAAHFERDKGKISFSANTPDIALEPGAQDRLSILLQMASLLNADPTRYMPGSTLSMQTVGPRDAEEWRFTVGADETLALPAGPHPTRKLSREPQREHDLRVDVWMASDLAYVPVQLRMTQSNGDFVQLQLKSVEIP